MDDGIVAEFDRCVCQYRGGAQLVVVVNCLAQWLAHMFEHRYDVKWMQDH